MRVVLITGAASASAGNWRALVTHVAMPCCSPISTPAASARADELGSERVMALLATSPNPSCMNVCSMAAGSASAGWTC